MKGWLDLTAAEAAHRRLKAAGLTARSVGAIVQLKCSKKGFSQPHSGGFGQLQRLTVPSHVCCGQLNGPLLAVMSLSVLRCQAEQSAAGGSGAALEPSCPQQGCSLGSVGLAWAPRGWAGVLSLAEMGREPRVSTNAAAREQG